MKAEEMFKEKLAEAMAAYNFEIRSNAIKRGIENKKLRDAGIKASTKQKEGV